MLVVRGCGGRRLGGGTAVGTYLPKAGEGGERDMGRKTRRALNYLGRFFAEILVRNCLCKISGKHVTDFTKKSRERAAAFAFKIELEPQLFCAGTSV